MEAREIAGYCTLCRSRCGTLNTVASGRLVSVRPDPAHPTGSAMCMKGRAAPELVHSPHRLRYPMRRTAPKGAADPGWQRISWDEALTDIAARLQQIRAESGAEAVVFGVTTPSGTPLSDSIDWIERFVRHFGSPNICYATEICNWHKDFAHAFTFGCGMPTPDVGHADLIMMWGHNPTATWLAMANALGAGRSQGAQLMVIDPRPTALSRDAAHWLPVRPGTDAVLALGWIRALIAANQLDHDFIRAWTNAPLLVRSDNGHFLREHDLDPTSASARYMVWDATRKAAIPAGLPTHGADTAAAEALAHPDDAALRGEFRITLGHGAHVKTVLCQPAFALLEQAVAAYTPEMVAATTTVPLDALLKATATLGDMVAAGKRIAYHAWSGVAQHTNATQTERAIAVLYALTGSFDQPGGNRAFPTQPVNPISVLSDLAPEQREKALGLDARPLGPPARGWVTARDTWQAILTQKPYAVRAFFGFGSNPLSSQGDTAMARDAFAALDFHVHCDLFDTPTGHYADILLPVGTPWEREGLRVGFELNGRSQQRVQLRQQLIPAQGEARSDNDIVFALATRLGMGDAFFGGSLEAGWNHMLAPLGITVAQLREHAGGIDLPLPERERFYEQQGFATQTHRAELYSELLLRHGQPALPTYIAPAEAQRAGKQFPLVLSSAKNGYFCHSQHRSLVSLRKRALQPLVTLSAELAAARQIAQGDPVIVSTRNGQARFIADVASDIAPDTVIGEFGWWQACPEIGAPGYRLDGTENRHFNGLISSEASDPVSGSVAHRSYQCNIERDPAFDPRRRVWRDWRAFTVAAITPEADGVITIRFEAADAGPLPDFLPGQHLTVQIPGNAAFGTLSRAYSLTGAARLADRRHYTIAVRHQRGVDATGKGWEGAFSGSLHRHIQAGMAVQLRAPGGRFTLPLSSPQPLVLIAGGIGITPFICQLESMAAAHAEHPGLPPTTVTLHYANRHSGTHAFRQRLSALQAILPALTIVDYYNEPGPEDRTQRLERISDTVISDAQIAQRARVYMCGPGPLMTAVRKGLVARGMPDFDIFHEAFQSVATLPAAGAPGVQQTHTVRFRRSARSATWQASDGNLLSFAESLGIALPNGCRVGQCESCAIRVIKGQGMHLNGEPVDDPETLLSCQAIPLTDIEIDA